LYIFYERNSSIENSIDGKASLNIHYCKGLIAVLVIFEKKYFFLTMWSTHRLINQQWRSPPCAVLPMSRTAIWLIYCNNKEGFYILSCWHLRCIRGFEQCVDIDSCRGYIDTLHFKEALNMCWICHIRYVIMKWNKCCVIFYNAFTLYQFTKFGHLEQYWKYKNWKI